MHNHRTEKCSCGQVILTCRCPKKDKPVIVRTDACSACRKRVAAESESCLRVLAGAGLGLNPS